MTAKKYVACLTSILALLIIINLILWHGYVKEIFIQGDLSRLGSFKINKAITPDKKFPALHVELTDYLRSGKKEFFDIITMGDSFSNGNAGNYYQDILASECNLKILNVNLGGNNILVNLYILIKSGLLDEIKPKMIILESVARSVQYRFGREEISSVNIDGTQIEKLASLRKNMEPLTSGIFSSVIFRANLRFLRDIYYRKNNPESLSPSVFIAELDRKLFTNKNQENLFLYLYEDLFYSHTSVNIAIINKNLNSASKILAKKNIKLAFMPCVDKYDLYYPYIKNKHGRRENNLFEELRKVPNKKYIFIDTKKILREALERGEKDLYWLNDTHWSWRGMSIICRELGNL